MGIIMSLEKKIAAFIGGVVIAANLAMAKPAQAEEYNPNGWPIPDIKSSRFIGQTKEDLISEIPGKETILRIYKTSEGTYFNSLSLKGKIYGFYVDTDGKPPMEYTILDREGDNIFRYKSSKERELITPDYLLELTNFSKN